MYQLWILLSSVVYTLHYTVKLWSLFREILKEETTAEGI